MRIGDRVIYRDADGEAHNALVVGVGGSGPSNGKVLDLDVPDLGDHTLLGCSHVADAEEGCGAWELGAPVPEPEEITAAVIHALVMAESVDELADESPIE